MSFLIQQTLIYAVPLMIVALAGVFAERSGIINLALEGIMIFGAFIGVLFVRQMQGVDTFIAAKAAGDWGTLQGLVLLAMLMSAAMGALFSLLLSFALINLRADQTIGGTALNLLAPALVLFFIRIIANQNTLNMASGDSASWFMIKKSTLGIEVCVIMPGDIATGFTAARRKSCDGDDVYHGRIARSVAVMEHDEQTGMTAEFAGQFVARRATQKRAKLICTMGHKYALFVFLMRILPTGLATRIVGRIYAS